MKCRPIRQRSFHIVSSRAGLEIVHGGGVGQKQNTAISGIFVRRDVDHPARTFPHRVMLSFNEYARPFPNGPAVDDITAILTHHIWNWDEWSQKNVPTPMITGHEFSGEIVAVGSEVDRPLKIGQRVSAEGHVIDLNSEAARAGHFHLDPHTRGIGVNRQGAFAEFVVAPAFNVIELPDDVSDDVASILDPFGNAVHTAQQFDLLGEDVLVTGAGPIGMMAAAVARHAGARTRAVRDALLNAQEPATLLFQELPHACDLEPFNEDEPADTARATEFVDRLQTAVSELRADYDQLLQRLTRTVASVVTPDALGFDRVELAARASRVALTANAPRLKSFAMRLRDPGTSDDAWIDALAGFVIAKPTVRWSASDEARCVEELAGLADLFHRVEAIAFRTGELRPSADAIGVTLTRADGVDLFQVVESGGSALDEGLIREFETHLPGDRATRIQYLSRMLWSVLEEAPAKATEPQVDASRRERS